MSPPFSWLREHRDYLMHDPGRAGTSNRAKRESFEAEALPHLDAVYRFALRLSGSPDVAEDLVQDTFLRAYRSWDQYTPGTRCKSWLFTICRNVFLRLHERGRRHDEILSEAAGQDARQVSGENPVFAATPDLDPESRFFGGIVDQEVVQAIDELPEEYRVPLLLSDLEGLRYDEIAEVMDVPIGTVKSRLFRGRRRLQKRLYEYAVSMNYISQRSSAEPQDG